MVYGWVSTQPNTHLERKSIMTIFGWEGLKPLRTEIHSMLDCFF